MYSTEAKTIGMLNSLMKTQFGVCVPEADMKDILNILKLTVSYLSFFF